MKKKFAITALLIASFISCTNKDTMTIEPIDKELNSQLLTGERLDPNLFSRADLLQYYQVSDTDGVPQSEIQEKLNGFVEKNYDFKEVAKFASLTIFFYKKEMLTDYERRDLFESARDNESGSITGQDNNKLSVVLLRQVPGSDKKLVRQFTLYDKNAVLLNATDTLNINQ
ncbi:hypothetical protein FMM05_05420 [Flavobacterium zepuense]|uniref:Lipoprotein n=1 Tax=Flavobacterium zepuense TaxID=2593302 RepID=A0A552V5B1_9FLAO|nr:hypothetical protein [Flavobacterium zepuense]TRW25664.1 hypothetical protein FMM05_05420 [Flavobacterium zepuense]